MRFMKFIAMATSIALVSSAFVQTARAGSGDAVVAGAAGFAIGTLFGSATARPRYYAPRPVYVAPPPVVVYEPAPIYYAPAPWTPDWYAYCARKYESFDARSGTFIGFDGFRHMCI